MNRAGWCSSNTLDFSNQEEPGSNLDSVLGVTVFLSLSPDEYRDISSIQVSTVNLMEK